MRKYAVLYIGTYTLHFTEDYNGKYAVMYIVTYTLHCTVHR